MRYYAVHDTDGNITTVVGQPDQAPAVHPTSVPANHRFTELDVSKELLVSDDPAALLELAAQHRVEAPEIGPARLEPREQST